MKSTLKVTSIVVLSLGLAAGAFAADKKTKDAVVPAPAAAAAAKTTAESKPEDEKSGKTITMYSRVDSIDAAKKTFTTKRKDGIEVKNTLGPSAEVRNNGAAAKFDDIKVGDMVSGSRVKKSTSEYEILKITKFGAPTSKKGKEGDKKTDARQS